MDKNFHKQNLSEFFDSGVGLDFYIKSRYSGKHIKFREELKGFLCKSEEYWQRYKANGPREKFDLLLGLDQYGDKDFNRQEIMELINICNGLTEKYNSDTVDDQKVRYFSMKLKELCEEALQGNNIVEALGD
ncbi:hypothetical protein [Bacillus sp. OAE603]|uniref:hypothetical protein n=1 Tax=Gottfriedia sp. OAE603 TaxID=2663872 RepID=UPI001789393C